ncbi:MAG: extracellular solute-binding protein [Spirochaetia bacterium]|nr:extracellular solute-binding protein [Spirochaetia bacterium]
MQKLFILILAILVVFSQIILFRNDKIRVAVTGAPVIYWVTDPNPARIQQIALFRQWLKKNNFADIDVRVDTANSGLQKTIIQSVTGTAGDMIDMPSGSVGYLKEMGVLKDMSQVDKEFGYKDSDIYEPTRPDIFMDGKHYAFPCNIGLAALLVNRDAFRKAGMEPPPSRWDFASFEAIGREFVKKANAGKKRQESFMMDTSMGELMRRSLGVSYFNETLTKAAINRPEYIDVLKRIYRWIYVDHLLPSAAERASFTIEQGYGGLSFQLFFHGQYAMIHTGRWAMIQLRDMKAKFEIGVAEYPHGGYPNALAVSRSIVVYAGSKHPELPKYFCAFLRSEDYNMHIVRDSDGNPPETPYLDREEFLRPVGHENEWLMHQGLGTIAKTIAIGREFSPYVLYVAYQKFENRFNDGFISGIYTAEQTAKLIDDVINEEIRKYLARNPGKQADYDKALERQKQIDALKKEGKKIPLALVDNIFLKRYYKDTGRGE